MATMIDGPPPAAANRQAVCKLRCYIEHSKELRTRRKFTTTTLHANGCLKLLLTSLKPYLDPSEEVLVAQLEVRTAQLVDYGVTSNLSNF